MDWAANCVLSAKGGCGAKLQRSDCDEFGTGGEESVFTVHPRRRRDHSAGGQCRIDVARGVSDGATSTGSILTCGEPLSTKRQTLTQMWKVD